VKETFELTSWDDARISLYVIMAVQYGRSLCLCVRGFCLSIYPFPSPNLSGRRLDVYHTSSVALVRI